jgi:hypothetical protein
MYFRNFQSASIFSKVPRKDFRKSDFFGSCAKEEPVTVEIRLEKNFLTGGYFFQKTFFRLQIFFSERRHIIIADMPAAKRKESLYVKGRRSNPLTQINRLESH